MNCRYEQLIISTIKQGTVTDIENEGVFKYGNDESPLSWHNWNTQSGPIGNNEAMNCVKMDAAGIWQIDNCNNKLTFVCEGN